MIMNILSLPPHFEEYATETSDVVWISSAAWGHSPSSCSYLKIFSNLNQFHCAFTLIGAVPLYLTLKHHKLYNLHHVSLVIFCSYAIHSIHLVFFEITFISHYWEWKNGIYAHVNSLMMITLYYAMAFYSSQGLNACPNKSHRSWFRSHKNTCNIGVALNYWKGE